MAAPEPDIQEKDPRLKSRAECQPLLEAATKNLYRKNAFRVLGLDADAGAREISKHGAKVKQMAELGMANAVHARAFPMSPPPSRDEIRDMLQRLQDPEKRMVDEFFWFWPEQFGKSPEDPAIQRSRCGRHGNCLQNLVLEGVRSGERLGCLAQFRRCVAHDGARIRT